LTSAVAVGYFRGLLRSAGYSCNLPTLFQDISTLHTFSLKKANVFKTRIKKVKSKQTLDGKLVVEKWSITREKNIYIPKPAMTLQDCSDKQQYLKNIAVDVSVLFQTQQNTVEFGKVCYRDNRR